MKAISKDGEITEDAYGKMMEVLVDWGDIERPIPPLGKFYDPSILEDARKAM